MMSLPSLDEVRVLLGEEAATLSDEEVDRIRQQAGRHAQIICDVIRQRHASRAHAQTPNGRNSNARRSTERKSR